jgi:copper oxidase (laccase) domain-containing protein
MKDESVRKSFLISLKLNPAKLVCADQIHSSNVKIVGASDRDTFVGGCDGLITADKEIILGIFTADCVPLLVSYGNGELKAAIHIGWKGLSAGIIENSLEILQREFCVRPEEIKVYIGSSYPLLLL